MKHLRLFFLPLLALLAADPAQPQAPEAIEHYRTGYELLKNRNFRNASIELEQATTLDSTYWEAFVLLGETYRVLNNYSKGIEAFEHAQKLNGLPDKVQGKLDSLYYHSALVLYEKLKYREVIAQLEKLLQRKPNSTDALYLTGRCYSGLKESEKAQVYFEKAIEVDPQHAKSYKALADIQSGSRDYGPAAETYRKAIAVDSTYMDAYGGLAQVMIDTEDLEGTVALLRKAVAIDPQYAEGYLLLGTALNRLGRQHEAVEPLRRATELAPKDAQAHYRLGEAYYGKDDYRKAIESGERAVRLGRSFHPAELLLGDAYAKLGQVQDARTWYTRAMQDSRFRDYCKHQIEELERTTSGQ